MILTIRRIQTPRLPESGCLSIDGLAFMRHPVWRERAEVEHDESLLQPIPYLVLRDAGGQVWCYQRMGGDARLDGRLSCGVGGHVEAADATHPESVGTRFSPEVTLRHALLRELGEELGGSANDLRDLRLQGLIYEGISAIGRVHLGVFYSAQWRPPRPPQPRHGEALRGLGFLDPGAIATDPRFEFWSRLAVQHLLQTQP